MRFPRKRGSTSVMVRVFIPDNSVTNGAGISNLTSGSTNLVIAYIRELDGSATTYTGANIEAQTTIGTYQAPSSSSKIRFKPVDTTNFPGLYELQFHDSSTAFGTGDASRHIVINIFETSTTALKIGPNAVLIPLSAYDVSEGESNVIAVAGTTQTARDLGGNLDAAVSAVKSQTDKLVFTGTGKVDASVRDWVGDTIPARTVAGVPKVDVADWLGAAPNALQSGRVDSYVGAILNGVIAAASFATGALDAVWSTAARTLTAFGFTVTAGTVTDKTGYALTSAYDPAKTAAQAGDAMALTSGERTTLAGVIWAALTSGMGTAGSIGKKLADWVLGSDSKALLSTDSQAGVTIPTVTAVTNDVGITQAGADKAWSSAARTLTSFGTLVADIATAVWGAATRTLSAFGFTVATTDTPPDNAGIAAIKTVTDQIRFTVANQVDSNALTGGGTGLTAQQTRDAMKLAPTAGAPAAGSVDAELDAVVANADVATSTRLATGGYTAPDNAGIASAASSASAAAISAASADSKATAIKAKTDNLPTDPADESLIIAATDAIKADTAAVKLKTDNLPATPAATGDAMTLTSGERDAIAAALLDLVDAIETGLTPREALRIILGSAAGETDGAGTGTFRLKSLDGTKVRTTTTTDIAGNRTGVTPGDLT